MYLELKNVCKSFGEKEVVKDLSLDLQKGDLLCLLGASGCGKTTTLKMISGFLKTDKGQILVDGQDITRLEPEKRPVSTVFQSYALFPHMSVLDNVIYGLKFQGVRKKEARQMGMEYLKIVDMEEYAQASIGEISGGQQQRVALVRSLITRPKVLLLDEPLSNLDAKLRVKMREEIREIQKKYEITMVFVTHDQEEAMVLGDKIAIMDEGRLVQVGKPEEVYLCPQNAFARDFLGISNQFVSLTGEKICCRPEELEFAQEGIVKGVVRRGEFLGFYRQYEVETKNREYIIVRTERDKKVEPGQTVWLRHK